MKTRQGFVSNSSSASFILDKSMMEDWQIEAVKNTFKYMQDNFADSLYVGGIGGLRCSKHEELQWVTDTWEIKDEEGMLDCYTSMTNFELPAFVRMIGVPETAIHNLERWG